jgi:hypothetical protein
MSALESGLTEYMLGSEGLKNWVHSARVFLLLSSYPRAMSRTAGVRHPVLVSQATPINRSIFYA